MKIKVTLVIMSLLGTLSHSSKLLKVPRVYNAFVTSDEDLRSSQVYPVLGPVIQGFQYSVPSRYVSSNVYRTFSGPSQTQYSTDTYGYAYSVHNTVKENYYHEYNVVEGGLPFQFQLPITLGQPIFFIRNGNAGKVGDNRFLHFESSPVVEPEDGSPPDPHPLELNEKDPRLQRAQRYRAKNTPIVVAKGIDRSPLPVLNGNKPLPTESEEPKTDGDGLNNHSVEIEDDDLVKNNRPEDKSIVDVPPPPIPIRWKTSKKPPGANNTEEEYPPPPVGFI